MEKSRKRKFTGKNTGKPSDYLKIEEKKDEKRNKVLFGIAGCLFLTACAKEVDGAEKINGNPDFFLEKSFEFDRIRHDSTFCIVCFTKKCKKDGTINFFKSQAIQYKTVYFSHH